MRLCVSKVVAAHAQEYKRALSPRTRLVALAHVSNVLGCVLDTAFVVEQAHKVRAAAAD